MRLFIIILAAALLLAAPAAANDPKIWKPKPSANGTSCGMLDKTTRECVTRKNNRITKRSVCKMNAPPPPEIRLAFKDTPHRCKEEYFNSKGRVIQRAGCEYIGDISYRCDVEDGRGRYLHRIQCSKNLLDKYNCVKMPSVGY